MISPSPEKVPPASILILGLGNDILTDDAVGLLVARRLREILAGDPRVTVQETTEMGLALLDFITGYESVVIIDSIQTGQASPGHLHELDPAQFRTLVCSSPHFLGVKETLELGRQLGLAMPSRVRVFGIEVTDPFTLGTHPTPSVDAALPEIASRIAEAVQSQCLGENARAG